MRKSIFGMLFISLLAGLAAFSAGSEMQMTVPQLVGFIKSSIGLKYTDKQVAEYLKHVKLTNKLDDQTIEDLQNLGAGPKTVGALKELGETTAKLAVPPPVVEPAKAETFQEAPPDSIEQGKILDAVREYALNYTKQLPNYICIRVDRRSYDSTGSGNNWRLNDTVTTKVSYYEGKEDYKVVLVNNLPVQDTSLEKLGGTISEGEFASMMREIFQPESEARFEWARWGKLRGKICYVFSFDIDQAHSHYRIVADRSQEIVPAYRGEVFVDVDTKVVTRIKHIPYDIPSSFPIQHVETILDYDYTKIGTQEFLLPMRALVTSRSSRYMSKNEEEFRMYRKFGVESTFKAETPDALPDDKTKEEKPKEKPIQQ
jgi:hypothetical protein